MYKKLVADYKISIKEGPSYKCSSCNGRFFHKSTHKSSRKKIEESIGEKVNLISTLDADITLCITCENSLKKMEIPKLCTLDGLQLEPIPEVLRVCNAVEERLCSPIIPFEQIKLLGFYGKQNWIKGNVVNVPIDLPTTVQSLPRRLEDCHTIQIKFKRMVSHKTDYIHERIRPSRVWNAMKYLCEQSLFKEHKIEVNLEWMDSYGADEIDFVVNEEDRNCFEATNPDAKNMIKCDSKCDKPITGEDEDCNEERSESSDDEFIEIEEVNAPGESETMIQDNNVNGLILAPGEGHKPISFFSADCEYLAFPKLYCGKGFNKGNPKNLSISDLAKYKLRYFDRRFAECPQILFFLLRQKQIDSLRQAINVVLKKRDKTHSQELKVGDVLDKQTIDHLIRNDEAYKILAQDRTSPSFWEKKMRDLMAMIRQLGVPTFFLTLSAAETQWNELICILVKISSEKDITEEMARDMQIDDKYRLIKNDPVTCAQYFDHRFRELLKVLKNKCGPFAPYELIDYFVRVEFQHRGSPHVHCLLWLENAPNIRTSVDMTAVELFIDQFITCESDESEELNELVKFQNHRHSKSCRRNRRDVKICRFGIPFYPMRCTRVLSPFSEEEEIEFEVIDFVSKHKAIQEKIVEIDERLRKKDISVLTFSFDEMLSEIGLSEDMYIMTIRSTLSKKSVFIRRQPKDIRVNAFNKEILRLFGSNMDIQYILDPYGCVHYIVNYISKSYRGVSKLMREAIKDVRKGYTDNIRRLRIVGQVFLSGSEVSAQEAVYILLSMPLTLNSRQCIFINTGESDKRTKMVKRRTELLQLDPESTDIMATGLLDYYINRPDNLKNVCLADFAAKYQMVSSSKTSKDIEYDQETYDDIEQILTIGKTNKIRVVDLKNPTKTLCTLVERKNTKIIRYVHYNKNTKIDKFCREKLMLYMPWRDEEKDIDNQDIKALFNQWKDHIIEKEKNYIKESDIDYESIKSELELQYDREEELEDAIDSEFRVHDLQRPENSLECDILSKPNTKSVEDRVFAFRSPTVLADEDYQKLIRSLNQGQREYLIGKSNLLICNQSIKFHINFHYRTYKFGKNRKVAGLSTHHWKCRHRQICSHSSSLSNTYKRIF